MVCIWRALQKQTWWDRCERQHSDQEVDGLTHLCESCWTSPAILLILITADQHEATHQWASATSFKMLQVIAIVRLPAFVIVSKSMKCTWDWATASAFTSSLSYFQLLHHNYHALNVTPDCQCWDSVKILTLTWLKSSRSWTCLKKSYSWSSRSTSATVLTASNLSIAAARETTLPERREEETNKEVPVAQAYYLLTNFSSASGFHAFTISQSSNVLRCSKTQGNFVWTGRTPSSHGIKSNTYLATQFSPSISWSHAGRDYFRWAVSATSTYILSSLFSKASHVAILTDRSVSMVLPYRRGGLDSYVRDLAILCHSSNVDFSCFVTMTLRHAFGWSYIFEPVR